MLVIILIPPTLYQEGQLLLIAKNNSLSIL